MATDKPSVALVGSGNVAWHLGHALLPYVRLEGVYSATPAHCSRLAQELDCKAWDWLGQIPATIGLVLIAVSDAQIESVSAQLGQLQALVVHTSGSVPMEVLGVHSRRGVWYPFQTFTKNQPVDWHGVPFLVETNTTADGEWLSGLARQISSHVHVVNSDQRRQLHLAAVMANNFGNHLWSISASLLSEFNLPFSMLENLLHETVRKALVLTPMQAQTGPAVRGDQNVMRTHLQLLEAHPHWQEIYRCMSTSIATMHGLKSQSKDISHE